MMMEDKRIHCPMTHQYGNEDETRKKGGKERKKKRLAQYRDCVTCTGLPALFYPHDCAAAAAAAVCNPSAAQR